jgi:hypothetical protein
MHCDLFLILQTMIILDILTFLKTLIHYRPHFFLRCQWKGDRGLGRKMPDGEGNGHEDGGGDGLVVRVDW